jgi:SnoaL-like domain
MDDGKLQLLLDRAEISDVQLRYATGLDSRDWPLFRSCFTDEVETDFTSVFGVPQDEGVSRNFVCHLPASSK